MTPDEKGDAGWLRGQTTRRRDHRRPDGGPERRQRCPDGGPEHRYEWYTAYPPCVSRPKATKSRGVILAPCLPPWRSPRVINSAAPDRRLLRLKYGAHSIECIPCLPVGGQREQMGIA